MEGELSGGEAEERLDLSRRWVSYQRVHYC